MAGSTPYWVKISTYENNGGNGKAFDFCLEEGPPLPGNNACSGATAISVSANGACSNESGTTVDATSTTSFPCTFGGGETYLDLWYSFTAPAGGAVTFHSGLNSPFATVYEGSCGGLSAVANGCLRGSGTVDGLTNGNTYYLAIFTSGTTGTSFDFCLEIPGAAPSNNSCATAIPATLNNAIAVNSTYATADELPPCVPFPILNLPDLWYTFTAPVDGEVGYSFSNGNILMTVYEDGTCGSLTEVACVVPAIDPSPVTGLTAGATYYAQLSSLGSTSNGTSTISGTVSGGPNTWTGSGGNDLWNNANNWSLNLVPIASHDVVIPSPFNVIIPAGITGLGNTLTVEEGATLETDPTGELDITNS